jgi:hypothetical protein
VTQTTTIRAALTLGRLGYPTLACRLVYAAEGDKWTKWPTGWDRKSIKSFWDSIGGSVTKCIKKLEGVADIDDPGAFCAALKDKMREFHGAKEPTRWRGKK